MSNMNKGQKKMKDEQTERKQKKNTKTEEVSIKVKKTKYRLMLHKVKRRHESTKKQFPSDFYINTINIYADD